MGDNFMFTVAGQRFRADIASIAQSLRAIAQAIKEEQENKQEGEQAFHLNHCFPYMVRNQIE